MYLHQIKLPKNLEFLERVNQLMGSLVDNKIAVWLIARENQRAEIKSSETCSRAAFIKVYREIKVALREVMTT